MFPFSLEPPSILSSDTESELDCDGFSQIVSEGLSEVLPPEISTTVTPVPFSHGSPQTSTTATPVPFSHGSPQTSTTATPVPFNHSSSPCEMRTPVSSFSTFANRTSEPLSRNCRGSLLRDGSCKRESSTSEHREVQVASEQSLQGPKNINRDLESYVCQLAISVREYVGRSTGNTLAGRQPVTPKDEKREPVLQQSSNGSEEQGPVTKAQTSVNRVSRSKMWIPKQLPLTSLTPNHSMHYSDPLNFTLRLPRERAQPWSKPANLHKDAVKQKSALPPWGVKRQTVNTTISQRPQLLSQEDKTCPELPPHPLLYQMTVESNTNAASDKSDSGNASLSKVQMHNVRNVKAEFTVKNVFSENVSDIEDDLHFGLAGPGLPTQGALEAMQQVLK